MRISDADATPTHPYILWLYSMCSTSSFVPILWFSILSRLKVTDNQTTGYKQILQSIGIDYIDESEVLTPADEEHHINKHNFKVPFVCGARNLGEALRRISEGAAFIRTKGEAGTGNVVEA
jgi:hypothetical protein